MPTYEGMANLLFLWRRSPGVNKLAVRFGKSAESSARGHDRPSPSCSGPQRQVRGLTAKLATQEQIAQRNDKKAPLPPVRAEEKPNPFPLFPSDKIQSMLPFPVPGDLLFAAAFVRPCDKASASSHGDASADRKPPALRCASWRSKAGA